MPNQLQSNTSEPSVLDQKIADESLAYVGNNFLTLEQLGVESGVSSEALQELMANRCLPKHSYEIDTSHLINSSFGCFQTNQITYYYARSLVEWATDVFRANQDTEYEEIAQNRFERFSRRYCTQLETLNAHLYGFEKYYDGDHVDPNAIRPVVEDDWEYLMDGVYGVCTLNGTPEEIVTKEVMIRRIDLLTDERENPR